MFIEKDEYLSFDAHTNKPAAPGAFVPMTGTEHRNTPKHSTTDQGSKQGSHSDNRSNRKTLSRVLLITGILLLLAAATIVGFMAYNYISASNAYSRIAVASGLNVTDDSNMVNTQTTLADLTFDWPALAVINPDIVAWVLIPGTRINYPIVQGPNNEYYLNHLFDTNVSSAGTVFLDYEGSATLDAQNNIVYGHNMLDGSMFADITRFTDQDYFDQHRTVFVCTPAMNIELRTFAVEVVSQDAPLRRFGFATPASFQTYLDTLLADAVLIAPGHTNTATTQVYSFVTCDNIDNSIRIMLSAEPMRTQTPNNQGAPA